MKIKASPRLCMCTECKVILGSCSLFKEYELNVESLNKVSLRSNFQEKNVETETETDSTGFLLKNTVVAVAADDSHHETVWFIMIEEEEKSLIQAVEDSYGNIIPPNQPFLSGYFLEPTTTKCIYQKSRKITYFYKETVVYPFVQAIPNKRGYEISNNELCEVLAFVEHNGMANL